MKRLLFWGLVMPALLRRLAPRWLTSPLQAAARRPWMALAVVLPAAAVAGVAVAGSGIVPLRASAGHWAVTEWLLQFGKRQSVRTHAAFLSAPPLDDPSLVLRGAGHYELGCAPCHGSVAGQTPRIPQAMLPPPPDLADRTPQWSVEQLFYIVKHGLKFTGMPAWPAQQRDDEVWAVVAFLRRLPELDAHAYRELARADVPGALWELPEDLAAPEPLPDVITGSCGRCHGLDGTGRGVGAFPKLAGQRAEYMARALAAYAAGRRYSGIMGPIAASLTSEQRNAAARYYASLRPPPAVAATLAPGVSPLVARGRAIALEGDPRELIPACVECHGPAEAPKNDAYPRLAGQHRTYLAQQLRLMQEERRGGSEYLNLMHAFVGNLSPDQIDAVSAYFAALAPAGGANAP